MNMHEKALASLNSRANANAKRLAIPPDEIGRIIGRNGRNIAFINQMIAPGKITVRQDCVVLHGDLANKTWLSRTIQILHSARRGGIIKWFETGYAATFVHKENWLRQIRALETKTKTRVQQQLVEFDGETYDVWLILGRHKAANVEKAIRNIGKLIHERHSRRAIADVCHADGKRAQRLQEKKDKERTKKERSKLQTLRMKSRRSKKERFRHAL
tara:strand:- start:812 stop:1456 length:645 start_codon:yes stop_codon:yes gene_type:complete